MAYRVGCERSDLVGGLVPYGMNWMEPAAGHPPKDLELSPGTTYTDALLGMHAEVRTDPSRMCDPDFTRPHYSAIGTEDVYAGDTAGAYEGKTLWMDYSPHVLGCVGEPYVSAMPELVVPPWGQCWEFPSCPELERTDSNVYCAVQGMGHETTHQATFLATAYRSFFDPGFSYECDGYTGLPTPEPTSTYTGFP